MSEQIASVFRPVVEAGWGAQPTSGEGALCGANALRQSLQAQHGVVLSPELVVEAARVVLDPDADPGADPILQGRDNFTGDQLAAVALQCGYRLGVVDVDPATGGYRAFVAGDPAGEEVLWVHHDANHWSSVGPSSNSYVEAQPP